LKLRCSEKKCFTVTHGDISDLAVVLCVNVCLFWSIIHFEGETMVSSHLSGGSLVRAAIQPNPGLGKKLRIMVDRLLTIYRVRLGLGLGK